MDWLAGEWTRTLLKHGLIEPDQADAHRKLLNGKPPPATAQFIATAQAITSEMSSKKRDLIDVLEAFRQLKNQLATTNYDSLLLEAHTSLTPVTWRDKAAVLAA